MQLLPIPIQVSSNAMKRLRETIHENEERNKLADRIRTCVNHILKRQALAKTI